MNSADFIARELARQGVRHVFGVGGANIEDLFAAVQRRRPSMRMVLGKHEHAAGTAADAYARLGGGLGVVFVTSGGGAMNLVHALAEARASRVPVLAIVGEPPTELQGQGAFQDTSGRDDTVDAAKVFGAVALSCSRVERPADVPRLLAEAIAIARGPRSGPAVLLIAKDRQCAAWPQSDPTTNVVPVSPMPLAPDVEAVRRGARMLDTRPVVIIAGDGVGRAGAGDELARIAQALDARVAVTPDGRDAFDNHVSRFLGVSGAMGHSAVERALSDASACLLVGTRMPILARNGVEARLRELPLVSVGFDAPYVTSSRACHLGGDLRENLRGLLAQLITRGETDRHAGSMWPTETPGPTDTWESPAILAAIERALPEESVVIVDAGNTGAQAIHHLRAPRGGRWVVAMGMAGMGYSFGAAVGAALATGRRCTVLAGDGAFFMHGLDIHTAIEHALPITYVIWNNRAHGMCLVRERLLMGAESGYNTFRPSRLGAGLAVMFPGLAACDCATPEELERALREAAASDGPAVIGIDVPSVEVPPFAAFREALANVRVGEEATEGRP